MDDVPSSGIAWILGASVALGPNGPAVPPLVVSRNDFHARAAVVFGGCICRGGGGLDAVGDGVSGCVRCTAHRDGMDRGSVGRGRRFVASTAVAYTDPRCDLFFHMARELCVEENYLGR